MPLLSDAKTCYVGTQPITKIYAGTQFVWGALQLRMVAFRVLGFPGNRLGAEFLEREECVDCASLKSTYQWRLYANGGWIPWEPFSGWTTDTNGTTAYIYVGGPTDNRFDNGLFELRTNGTVERINISLTGLPDVGLISPILSC